MNYVFTKRFITPIGIRLSFVIMFIMITWHITLLSSNAPYINSATAWLTTLLSPWLAIIGISVMVKWFVSWYSNDKKSDGISSAGDSWIWVGGDVDEGLIAIIGIILLIGIAPAILFLLPSEVLLGIAFHKQNVWHTITSNIMQYTQKEQIFVGVLGCLVFIATSTIIWEVVITICALIISVFRWVISGRFSKKD